MSQKVLITGATAGIGEATARALADLGFRLVLTGRRQKHLDKLTAELSEKTEVLGICFDVSDRESCERVFLENSDQLSDVSILVNNAGLALGTDSMDQAAIKDWETMIDVNIKGLLYMTRLALPLLEKNTPSHIVNLGSVAGRYTYVGGGVYCATKFAVRALTEGLRLDLLGKNIRVTNIAPGMVETEFSEVRLGDKGKAKDVYKGLQPLKAQDIAECIVWSLQRPAHVNIQEMVVYPTDQALYQVHREEGTL